ncbi:MAG: DUF493 domain-containing protein [Helicobacteraceae bacterium]|jgi:putative lipoic acid-binding regulatory protein|nr:DUF493 domain-containing protein [Helicobacteraceae bacterium]
MNEKIQDSINSNACVELQKPHIIYPCEWSYHLIGRDESAVHKAALNALKGKAHTINLSRRSSKGGFVSMKLTAIVSDESERLALFDALRLNEAILHVL